MRRIYSHGCQHLRYYLCLLLVFALRLLPPVTSKTIPSAAFQPTFLPRPNESNNQVKSHLQSISANNDDDSDSKNKDNQEEGQSFISPKGRCALVTGASSGIGKAIAYTLAKSGVNVCLVARRVDTIEAIAKELAVTYGVKSVAVATDVTVFSHVEKAVKEAEAAFGSPIDILVNNAGVMHYTYMKNIQVDQWTNTIDVNCKGVTNCLGAALPSILGTKRGHVINISSDAGRVVFPGLSVYSGTKFFIEALTKGLRLECAEEHGLKVTSIQPGDCKTEISLRDTDMEAREACAQSNKGRNYWLDPEDVANAVLFALTQPDHVAVNELMIEPKFAPA